MGDLITATIPEIFQWTIAALALIVSILTISNGVKIKSGVLATSTYAFGFGMLSIALAFFLLVLPGWLSTEATSLASSLFFIGGFLLLGFGSYQIYKMSRMR